MANKNENLISPTESDNTYSDLSFDEIYYLFTKEIAESLEKKKKYPAEIGKRAAKEFFEIHGTNAMFMEEDKL